MKTILVINDHSTEAIRASKLALTIAKKMKANLLMVDVNSITEETPAREYALADASYEQEFLIDDIPESLVNQLYGFSQNSQSFKPKINIDHKPLTNNELSNYIIKNDIWMIVKGTSTRAGKQSSCNINIQTVLNKVNCPLLLVPETFEIKDFEHLVYTVDLRYCPLQIVHYLKQLAIAYQSSVLIAHLTANNLPHIEENYALNIFTENISNNINYDKLYFDNIKERNPIKALDVMVNTMHTDLLALVNHQFHFEEIVGRYITPTLPEHVTIPLLIFPC